MEGSKPHVTTGFVTAKGAHENENTSVSAVRDESNAAPGTGGSAAANGTPASPKSPPGGARSVAPVDPLLVITTSGDS